MTLAIIQKFKDYWQSLETTISSAAAATGLSFAAGWAQLQTLKAAIVTEAGSVLVTSAPELEAAVMPIVTSTIAQLATKVPAPLAAFFTSAALNFVQDVFESLFPETSSQTTIAIAATTANPTLTPAPPLVAAAAPATKAA